MYQQQHLDSPPPTSQFRRPWSPEPFDPNPPSEPYRPRHDGFDDGYARYGRREASDVSVEALDLADYAATLRRGGYPDLPPDSYYSSSDLSQPRSHRHRSMPPPTPSDAGIDTSRFPAWSRHWYDNPSRLPPHDYDDIYSPPPQRTTKGPFDVMNTMRSPPFSSSAGHDSLVPWSLDPPDFPVDQGTKEERIRMLEREFAGAHPAFEVDDKQQSSVGMADPNGNLITQGPRKRLAARISQILMALAAAIPAIYAAAGITTTVKPSPSGTPAAYVLYTASVVTFIALFAIFAIRPCFRKRAKPEQEGIPGLTGMVLPGVHKKKKGKRGKKGYPQQQDVHVNLIVDPSMFRPQQDEEEEDWDASTAVSSNATKRKTPKRRSIMTSLMDERLWIIARARAKKILCLDMFLTVAWLAVFIYVLLGGSCKASPTTLDIEERAYLFLVRRAREVAESTLDTGVSSWCMAWNVSSAAACLLAVSSALCAFFGVKDLGASKTNPRKR